MGRASPHAAQSRSLGALEGLVHDQRLDDLEPHVVLTLEIPDALIHRCDPPPRGWDPAEPSAATRAVGNDWHDSAASPALLVPSVVSAGEFNLLINTRHPGWQWSWVVSGPEPIRFDPRVEETVRKTRRPNG